MNYVEDLFEDQPQRRYATVRDFTANEVLLPLGEYAKEHDIDGITRAIMAVETQPPSYFLGEDIDHDTFWAIVEANRIEDVA